MLQWASNIIEKTQFFMPHGHCYLWLPALLWLHVVSDTLIGIAYIGISLLLYQLVRQIRLPFSPLFIAFGLFIALCGLTHFMAVWTVWQPDYLISGLIKAATAAASVATAIGVVIARPHIVEVVNAARLSEERRTQLETAIAELEVMYKKVKEVDAVKTQFFANISHELRTPLALILGPTQNLQKNDNLTEHQKQQLLAIERNGKSLLKQVNDLLDVAKLEEAQMQLQSSHVDVSKLIRQLATQFEATAHNRKIHFTYSTPESLLADVDIDKLERITINLLSNAFKFTESGSIQLVLQQQDESFTLSVADSGPGIPEEQRQSVFDRFHQGDGSASRKHGGTGLGLSIVKDFVALHNGSVSLETSELNGALFSVALPLKQEHSLNAITEDASSNSTAQLALDSTLIALSSQSMVATPEKSANSNAPLVLIVEDTVDMADFIGSILSPHYRVAHAYDGEQGLQAACSLRPDLIVSDLMMPKLDGEQLVRQIRHHTELDSTPILLLTAKADDELRVQLLQSGAQDYLMKPFLAPELLARASNLVLIKRTGDVLRSELASASTDIAALADDVAAKSRQIHSALLDTEIAKERAEKASRVKSHFLALISHELRTPLSVINMTLQIADRQGSPSKSQWDRLSRSTRQLSTLIEGLLEYTRIESNKITLKISEIDIEALVNEVLDVANLQLTHSNVKIVKMPLIDQVTKIVSDRRLLSIALNNLMANAIKFTSAGQVSLEVRSGDHSVTFVVKDTGMGIAADDLDRIFAPFERLEPVHSKSIPGVGLGLALTHDIVVALGGTIKVQSNPNIGSEFAIHIPDRGTNNE